MAFVAAFAPHEDRVNAYCGFRSGALKTQGIASSQMGNRRARLLATSRSQVIFTLLPRERTAALRRSFDAWSIFFQKPMK